MVEQWQLYNEQGKPNVGQGATKVKVFGEGLLHGAAHVWIWRRGTNGAEILLQKRAANKNTWPNRYDISAAGHIDLGEEPITAALRETKEEIGIDAQASELKLISIQRANMVADSGSIENEFQWLYLLELSYEKSFKIQASEVAFVEWKLLIDFQSEVLKNNSTYVPHGKEYYSVVIDNITKELIAEVNK